MTSKQTPTGGLYSYVYNYENRLTSIGFAPVGKVAKTIAAYYYDGDGGRTRKIVYRYSDTSYNNAETYGILVTQLGAPTFGVGVTTTSTSTIYVGNLYEIEGTRRTNNIYLGSTRVAAQTGTEIDFYHNDHLGSTNVITDATGQARSLTEYEPFGKISRFEKYGTKINNSWAFFNSKLFDEESGLYYYGARYYDPKLGRFITPDTIVQAPSNPQTLNRYTYCNNNPVNLIDPTGHSWKKFWKSFAGAFVGAVVTVLTAGAGAPLWIAGMAGGFIGGGITGGLEGGWKGALIGAGMGAALGGLAGWGGGIAQAHNLGGLYTGGLIAAGAGVAGATNSWDSFAGGLIGGFVGSSFANGYLSAKNDFLSEQNPTEGIRAGTTAETNENWAFLGVGTTENGAKSFANENQMSVMYTKSRGFLSDLFRAGFKKVGVSGPYARQTANYLNVAEGKFILAHSEGTINLGAGIKLSAGIKFDNLSLRWIGPVMSKNSVANLSNSIGAQFSYKLNWGDPIGVLSTFNPIQSAIYGSVGLATGTRYHGTDQYVH